MSAIDTLRNDKDAIISIVSEHYILDQREIKEMKFGPFDNHPCKAPKSAIRHGEWVFCYHRDTGTLYIK